MNQLRLFKIIACEDKNSTCLSFIPGLKSFRGSNTHISACMVIFTGKGKKAEEQDLKKFKELTRKKGIPEENIVNVIETGKRTLFFLYRAFKGF